MMPIAAHPAVLDWPSNAILGLGCGSLSRTGRQSVVNLRIELVIVPAPADKVRARPKSCLAHERAAGKARAQLRDLIEGAWATDDAT